MKMSKISGKEIAMLILLAVLLIGVIYYMAFYRPLQAELAELAEQSVNLDEQINVVTAKAGKMKEMQKEIDEILKRPKSEITEIAPFDNKEVVFNMLNGILGRTINYSLSFADPDIQSNGTVRRNVSMQFNCETYEEAKAVIDDLTKSNWRCLVRNCAINAAAGLSKGEDEDDEGPKLVREEDDDEEEYESSDMLHNSVSVTATITFFESTKLSK